MRESVVAAGIMLLLAMSLQGCGHKGPLFLPPPEHAQSLSGH